jgi:predicted transcriptional regulator
MNKNNYFYRFRKDKEYQRLLQEEKKLLDIAIQIIEARRKRKITQVQLAKKVGMPQSQIARLESGSHNITLETLNKVANALDLRVKLAA